MKKIWIWVMLGVLILGACSCSAERKGSKINKSTAVHMTSSASPVRKKVWNAQDISKIEIQDMYTGQKEEYKDVSFLKEFVNFLSRRQYKASEEKFGTSYIVTVYNAKSEPAVNIAMGDSNIRFSEDVELGASTLAKGSYIVDKSIWNYAQKFYEGAVVDPSSVALPAKLTISEELSGVEMIDRGNTKVGRYDTVEQLHAFAQNIFAGQTFEITNIKDITDYTSWEDITAAAGKETQCMHFTFIASETYLEIQSDKAYPQLARGWSLLLSKDPEKPGRYELIAETRIFELKANAAFDKAFTDIFNANAKEAPSLHPDMLQALFAQKKPYFMEFVSKHLGIDAFGGREPEELKRNRLALDASGIDYTVIALYNPFDVRLLLYRKEKNNQWNFKDFIDFGGRTAGTEYHLEKAAEHTWIVGNRCRGYGTGEAYYFQEWYEMTPEGKRLAVSFPYSYYSQPPYGGHTLTAKSVNISDSGPLQITVDYGIVKNYRLNLPIANEEGLVEVTADKQVVFPWDAAKQMFISRQYAPGEGGITEVSPDCAEITRQCDAILVKYAAQLQENIDKLPQEENEMARGFIISGMRNFLQDCSDSEQKTALLKMLDAY